MANILPKDKQIRVLEALVEGCSIRSTERMTGVNQNTIMSLSNRVGQTCAKIMDEEMRNLNCSKVQVDEIWGFVGKKQKNVTPEDIGKGDVWTYVAIDADTKLVPSFMIGRRDYASARRFMDDLKSRMSGRIQLSTDGLQAYEEAVKRGFDYEVDYGQIVKVFASTDFTAQGRYSPGNVVSVDKKVLEGKPDQKHISTSYVERQNLTMRMHSRRLTRLTNGFSKKLENFEAAMALHFVYYNFVRRHATLRCTPAMEAGLTESFWSMGDLVDMAAIR